MISLYPNIGFSVVKLVQQMANISNEHYWAGLHFCKYWIVYNRLTNESVVVYSDSDWVQDPESYKSVTGYFTLMAYGVIFWISH